MRHTGQMTTRRITYDTAGCVVVATTSIVTITAVSTTVEITNAVIIL
jgi:hypothetical protein